MLDFLCPSIVPIILSVRERSCFEFYRYRYTSEKLWAIACRLIPFECMCVSFSILSRRRVSFRSSFFIDAKLWRRSLYVALRIRVLGWKRTETTPKVQSAFVAVDPMPSAHSDRSKVSERFPGVSSKRPSTYILPRSRIRFYMLHHRYHRASYLRETRIILLNIHGISFRRWHQLDRSSSI